MRSAIIVETPLQLLNAIEAKFALDLGECRLIVILSEPFPESAFRPLLTFGGWKAEEFVRMAHRYEPIRMEWIGRGFSNRFNEYIKELMQMARRRKVDRLGKGLGEVDNLVLGNLYAPHMQHLAGRVRAQRIYLLDDGTDTLRVAQLRNGKNVVSASTRETWLRKVKNRFRRAFIDWDCTPASSVTFFTSFSLDINRRDRCVKNEYAYLRRNLSERTQQDLVYFLGQPLVEDGYLSPDSYRGCISTVAALFRGRKFVYLPHRREVKANVDALRGMGLPMMKFDLPIEVQMATADMPKELCSFFSSALDNSRIIFGDRLNVTAFRIDQSTFHPGHEFVSEIYDYMRAHIGPNFRLMDLEGCVENPVSVAETG